MAQIPNPFTGWNRFNNLVRGWIIRVPFRLSEKSYSHGIVIADISPRASHSKAHFVALTRDALVLLESAGHLSIVQANVSAILNQHMRSIASGIVQYRWCLLDFTRITRQSRADEVIPTCGALIAGRAFFFELIQTPDIGTIRDVVAAASEFQDKVYADLGGKRGRVGRMGTD